MHPNVVSVVSETRGSDSDDGSESSCDSSNVEVANDSQAEPNSLT